MENKKCRKCGEIKPVNHFYKQKRTLDGLTSYCKDCIRMNTKSWVTSRPYYSSLTKQNNRAKEAGLPATWTYDELKNTLDIFGGCVFTGETENLSWDHVIPIKAGYGGTTKGNMIPVRKDLNSSKGFSNLITWHSWAVDIYGLKPEKLDYLLDWLAKENGMPVEEYKTYITYDDMELWDDWRGNIRKSKHSAALLNY